jgi:hypothetical protein
MRSYGPGGVVENAAVDLEEHCSPVAFLTRVRKWQAAGCVSLSRNHWLDKNDDDGSGGFVPRRTRWCLGQDG